MTDRTRLRNQITAPAVFAVLWAVKVFWFPSGIRHYAAAAAVALFIWLAGTKYLEYREKYPRNPE
jgi:hypothetical protein